MTSPYTITELAEILKCSKHTVTRLIKDKQIKAFKIIGNWRITEQALTEFITKQEAK